MKACFVLFLLCLTTSSSALKRKFPMARISGGKTASEGQFPWHALVLTHVLNENRGVPKCGGALISPKWILTAAHCIAFEGKIILKVEVELGMIYRYDENKTTLVAKDYVSHPEYDTETHQNDIGLIELPRNVKFSDRIFSISIISKQIPTGKKLTVSGFGITDSGSSSNYLLYVDVVKVDNDECIETYSNPIDSEKIVCCKGKGVKDSCKGDSGGPLIAYEQGQAFLVGIVSGGAECGSGIPGVYSSALAYRTWIKLVSKN